MLSQFPLSSRALRSALTAVAFGLLVSLPAAGWAQEGGEESSGSQGGSEASSEKQQEASSDEQQDEGESEERDKPDPDDPHYWAKVRRIQTVQKREFQKVNRFAASLYGGIIPNNIFERYYPIGLRLNYFILENIGIELAASYSFESSTSLTGVLQEPNGINARSTRVADSQIMHTNFGITWSPVYGKAALYEEMIGYFDMYLFGGLGMVLTKTPEFPNQPESDQPRNIKPEGVLGAGLAWYLGDNFAVRADFRQFLFQKVSSVGGVANPSEISVGGSMFF